MINKLMVVLFAATPALLWAAEVKLVRIDDPVRQCSANTIEEKWKPGVLMHPREVHYGDVNHIWLFGMGSTSVQVWDPDHIMDIKGPFEWYSTGKPLGVDEVLAFYSTNGMSVRADAKRGQRAQLIYTLARKYSKSISGGRVLNMVWTLPDANASNTMDVEAVWSDKFISTTDCIDIVVD